MRDGYSLDISLSHQVALNDGDPYAEIIQPYKARVLHMRDGAEVVAGQFDFYVANAAMAMDLGVDIVDAADSHEADLAGYCSAIFEPGTAAMFREEVSDQFECSSGARVLFLHLAKILPEHRGKRVGLVAAHKIIQQFGDGLVVAMAQPLQHRDGFKNEAEMQYETLEAKPVAALKRLSGHWQRLGFEPIGDSSYLGLSTAVRHPVPQLELSKREGKARSTKHATKKRAKK